MLADVGWFWVELGRSRAQSRAQSLAVRVVFQRYDVEPSAWAVVRWARETGFKFPTRRTSAEGDSAVEWKSLGVSRLHEILKNRVYAGVYAYGRRREKKVLANRSDACVPTRAIQSLARWCRPVPLRQDKRVNRRSARRPFLSFY